MSQKEKRRALRIALNVPTLIESIGQPDVKLPDALAKVYSRVDADASTKGKKYPGVVRDLSTNGAFLAGEPLPLLSRVAFSFQLEGFGQIEVLGWSLWRRDDDCTLTRPDGSDLILPKGFGVLFEAVPLEARIAIHKLVAQKSQ